MMLNVLIAEDNTQISIHLANMINTPNVRCVEILNEGSKVYQRVKELNPDFLILDLRLPGKNGLDILKQIDADDEITTRVYVYSGDLNYIAAARKYKCVDRFYSKNTPAEEISRQLDEANGEMSVENTRERIIEILFKMGFTYSLKGTKLINDGIYYSITNGEDKIYKIYEYIAKKYGQNTHTVKSDINTAINNMWRYTDRNRTRKILRLGACDRPSSKNVISMVKYHIAG